MRPARRTLGFQETIFSEITALAQQHDAVNLGQGFPDFAPPAFVLDAAREAVSLAHGQQYARGPGLPELVQVIAAELEPVVGRTLDPMTEVTVTVGATEGLFAAILALVEPGREAILIEPFYDAYPADVAIAGGQCRYVPLHVEAGTGRWVLAPAELEAAFSERTAVLLLNTPHNPTGKVFGRQELEHIAELCIRHDVVAICDEVYQHIVFDGAEHLSLAAIPGMRERTVVLGSAGKTFSVTGWKIGWCVACPELTGAIRSVHQWIPFCVATPLQRAVSRVLQQAPGRDYYRWLRELYQGKRDTLVQVLRDAGLAPLLPEGTYFVMADFSGAGSFEDDGDFCRHLTTQVGVAAIPPGAFYGAEHRGLASHLARFCFCKEDATLQAAASRLASWRASAPGGEGSRDT